MGWAIGKTQKGRSACLIAMEDAFLLGVKAEGRELSMRLDLRLSRIAREAFEAVCNELHLGGRLPPVK